MSIDNQITTLVEALQANTVSNNVLADALIRNADSYVAATSEVTFTESKEESVADKVKDAVQSDRKEKADAKAKQKEIDAQDAGVNAKEVVKSAKQDDDAEKAAEKAKASAEAKAMIASAKKSTDEAKAKKAQADADAAMEETKAFNKVEDAPETPEALFESVRTTVVLSVKHLGKTRVGEILNDDFAVKNIKELSDSGLNDLRVQLQDELTAIQIPF